MYSYIPSSFVVVVNSSSLIFINTSTFDNGSSFDFLTVPVIVVVSPIPQSVASTVISALNASTSKYDPT